MTKTDLANIALGHLGEARILNIDEAVPQAEHCRRMWNLARDGILRRRHWNFALRQSILAQLATPPAFDWLYAYALPSDYLLAIDVNGYAAGTGEAQFEIFGGKVFCDDTAAALTYVARVEDTEAWDASFCECFAYKLAALVAPSMTSAPGLGEKLAQAAEMALLQAFGPDNLETRPRAILAQVGSGYLAARLGIAPVPSGRRTVTISAPAPQAPSTPATSTEPVITLVTGTDGATYEATTFPNGAVIYKLVFTSLP